MIASDKQYAAAKKQLEMLTASLSTPKKDSAPSEVHEASRTQIQNLINEIQANMKEYDNLKRC